MDRIPTNNRERIVVIPAFSTALKILRYMGVTPQRGERVTFLFIMKCIIPVCVVFTLPIIGMIGHLYKSSIDELKMERIENLRIMIQSSIFTLIATMSFYHGDALNIFFENMSIYRFGWIKNAFKISTNFRYISIVFFFVVDAIVIGYAINNYYGNFYCDGREIKHDMRYMCGLVTPAWYPIELDYTPMKQILFLNNIMCYLIYFPVATVAILILPETALLLAARFQHLRKCLESTKLNGDVDITKRKLRYCIRYHAEIVRLLDITNNSVGYCLAPEYSMMALIIAILEFEVLLKFDFLSISQFALFVAAQWMICACGQLIEDESYSINKTLYDMKWYEMDPAIRSTFRIFLAKVRKPYHLKANPILVLNMAFLFKVIKGTYSLLMYLKQFSEE